MADKKEKRTILVIDHETYQDVETGRKFVTHSRPTDPAPDGRFDSPTYGWSDVLKKWVPLDDLDKSLVTDFEVVGA